MARGPSGSYALPAGNPVVAGTPIQSDWANTTLSDIAAELTNSLDRSGRGAMTSPLKLPNGQATAPALTFSGDQNTGVYAPAADEVALVAGGTANFKVTASTVEVIPTSITIGGVVFTPGQWAKLNGASFTGGVSVAGILAVSGNTTVGGTLGVTGTATLASLGVTGLTTLASLSVTGALSVAGASTLSSLSVAGASTLSSLSVAGASTFSSPVVAAKGSVSSPGIAFSGDSNTGIHSSGADILDLVTAGAAQWRVDASGRLLCPARKQPCFRATTSAAITAVGDFTTFSAEVDDASNFDATTGVFTTPVAGWYEFAASFYAALNGVGEGDTIFSIKTGPTTHSFASVMHRDSSTGRYATAGTGPIYLAAGATVQTICTYAAGTYSSISCLQFSGRLVG